MSPRLPSLSDTNRNLAAKLSVDALALFVLFGALYLVSEFVLPGIFSSRVNFFVFFLVLGGLVFLAATAGQAGPKNESALVSRKGQIALSLLATIFLFWGEKKLPLPILFGSAFVILLVFLSFLTDILGKPRSDTK
jgi:hypothetical protein